MRSYGAAVPLLSGAHLVELNLIELHFRSGTVRYNTSVWNLPNVLGQYWFSGQGVINVKPAAEDTTLEAHGAVVTLAALDPAQLARALSEKVKGRRGIIWHAVMNPDTFAVVHVQKEFSGRMGGLQIMGGQSNAR